MHFYFIIGDYDDEAMRIMIENYNHKQPNMVGKDGVSFATYCGTIATKT